MYLVFCIWLLFIVILVLFISKDFEKYIQKYSFAIIIFFGMIYLLLIPMYSVPDEYSHVDTAYLISNKILGIYENDYYGYNYKRSIDVDENGVSDKITDINDFRRIYTDIGDLSKNISVTRCVMKNVISNANIACYLPAALGVTFARCLNLNTLSSLLMGRFFNLLIYAIICFLAIKIYKEGQSIILLFSTTPVILQQAASFSYDCILNAIAILFFSLLFKMLSSKDNDNTVSIMLLLISAILLATTKGGVYLPLSLFGKRNNLINYFFLIYKHLLSALKMNFAIL